MAANLAFVSVSPFKYTVDPPYVQVPHLWFQQLDPIYPLPQKTFEHVQTFLNIP